MVKSVAKIFKSDSSPGVLLLFATIIALVIANNSFTAAPYHDILNVNFLGLSIHHWVNDVLMAFFFLGIGLEIKKELIIGNLANFKSAAFPVVAAFGGMLLPAFMYSLITFNTEYIHGFGIPMATDIAFAVGVLTLLGKRVPNELKIFLLTLAVADDLGAIVVIALFYSKGVVFLNLLFAAIILLILFVFNRIGIKNIFIYLVGGAFLWYFIFHSGIHATISGVLLAFTIPLRTGNIAKSPLVKIEHILSPISAFCIMPIFALANAGVTLSGDFEFNTLSIAIMVGLISGKPAGIFLFTFLAEKINFAKKPASVGWDQIFAVGILAGIGFTMSIFIASLTFTGINLDNAKLSILLGSFTAAVFGIAYFKLVVFKK